MVCESLSDATSQPFDRDNQRTDNQYCTGRRVQVNNAAVVEDGMSVRRVQGESHVCRYRTERNRRQGRKKTYKAIIRQTTATNENGHQIQHNQAARINVITTKSEQEVDQHFVQTL